MNLMNSYGNYKQMQVKTADEGALILMLYDGAILSLRNVQKLLKTAPLNREALANHIIKGRNIIYELIASLDFEAGGELSDTLLRLYNYFIWRIGQADLEKDPTYLDDVIKHLQDLQSAWETTFQNARIQQTMPSSSATSPLRITKKHRMRSITA